MSVSKTATPWVPVDVRPGNYLIMNIDTGKFLTIGPAMGTEAALVVCLDNVEPQQQWRIVQADAQLYNIVTRYNSVDVYAGLAPGFAGRQVTSASGPPILVSPLSQPWQFLASPFNLPGFPGAASPGIEVEIAIQNSGLVWTENIDLEVPDYDAVLLRIQFIEIQKKIQRWRLLPVG